jgi:hypothetical protein
MRPLPRIQYHDVKSDHIGNTARAEIRVGALHYRKRGVFVTSPWGWELLEETPHCQQPTR